MVDADRVYRLLAQASERVARLRLLDLSRDDPVRLDAAKYLLVTAVEAALDVAQHVVASEGWGAPSTNADAFRVLRTHGVLADASPMVAAVGLRNVLVHGYADVDDARVVAAVADLGRLEDFVAAVSAWLLRHVPEDVSRDAP